MILNLKTGEWAESRSAILKRYPYPPFWWLDPMNGESRRAILGRSLDRARTREKACLLGCRSSGGDLIGFSQATRLRWDSDHFGCEIWRLEHAGFWETGLVSEEGAKALIRETVRAARDLGCRSLQARVPADNLTVIHALEGTGFRVMEVYATWIFDLIKWEIPPKRNPGMLRDFVESDTGALVQLARSSYTHIPDRFHLDPHFPREASDELYAQWVKNSCSGEMAHFIAVAQHQERIIGYATLRDFGDYDGLSNVRIAQLGLGAVRPDFRNRGIVSDLVIYSLEWLKRRKGRFALISTQGNNIPAQRLFLKAGFRPAATAVTLHFWWE